MHSLTLVTGIKGRLNLEKGAPTNFSQSEKVKGVTVSLSRHGADPAGEEEAGGLSGRAGGPSGCCRLPGQLSAISESGLCL